MAIIDELKKEQSIKEQNEQMKPAHKNDDKIIDEIIKACTETVRRNLELKRKLIVDGSFRSIDVDEYAIISKPSNFCYFNIDKDYFNRQLKKTLNREFKPNILRITYFEKNNGTFFHPKYTYAISIYMSID